MPKSKDDEEETRFGSLLPYGGGGPGLDWDSIAEKDGILRCKDCGSTIQTKSKGRYCPYCKKIKK